MVLDLSSAYTKILPFLPQNLLNMVQEKKLRDFQKYIPPTLLSDTFGFELPLSHEETWIDFCFHLDLSGKSLLDLERYLEENKTQTNEVWHDCFHCFSRSRQQNFFTNYNLTNMCLEFDIGSSLMWPPKPSIFLGVSQTHDIENICKTLFGILQKNHFDFSFSTNLERCIKTCEEMNLEIAQIGLMLPRSSKGIKLCIRGENLTYNNAITSFLKAIHYPEESEAFIALLKELSSLIPHFFLQLDIDDNIHAKLGIEGFFKGGTYSEIKHQWENVLTFLVAEQLTSEEKKNAILAWMGGYREVDEASTSYHQFVRGISHIKVTYFPDKKPKAKIYLKVFQEQKNIDLATYCI